MHEILKAYDLYIIVESIPHSGFMSVNIYTTVIQYNLSFALIKVHYVFKVEFRDQQVCVFINTF